MNKRFTMSQLGLLIALGVGAGGSLLIPASAVSAELGRLFLAPHQRAALDRARVAEPEPVETPEPELQLAPEVVEAQPIEEAASSVTVDGFVSRSGGAPTIWINGMDSFQGDFGALGLDPKRVTLKDQGVNVPIHTGSGEVTLKPGQSFDPESSRISDAYDAKAAENEPEPE